MANDTKALICRINLPVTSYPGIIDTFISPLPNDFQSSPGHAKQHRKANDALYALENIVGIGSILTSRFLTLDQASEYVLVDGTRPDETAIRYGWL